jgi:hypothetical protein
LNSLVFMERALLDRDVDADNVLPHNAPRADVQMSVDASESTEKTQKIYIK